jgi:hypothetical protein
LIKSFLRLMEFLGSSTSQALWRRCFAKSFRSTSTSSFSTSAYSRLSTGKQSDRLNYNSNISFDESPADHVDYDIVTANDLEGHTDSLYNPNYGYFPHQATIFTSNKNIDFGLLRDSVDFQAEVAKRYAEYGADEENGPGKQLWHTPTELFKVNLPLSRHYDQYTDTAF